jgi:Domain of unknown function (DUF5679)
MAKKRKAADTAAAPAGRAVDRQLARLAKGLARLEREEAKRSRQLDEVRAAQAVIRARIADLQGALSAAAAPLEEPAVPDGQPAGPDGPQAYCMREKRKVAIAGPELVVLGNGRHAYAGSCPDCGARVIAIVRAGPAV